MTAPAFSPEVVAGAIARRNATAFYRIDASPRVDGSVLVLDRRRSGVDEIVASCSSEEEAEQWIDCQAFAAGLQALLPVDYETKAMDAVREQGVDADFPDELKAYIHHITRGSVQHDIV